MEKKNVVTQRRVGAVVGITGHESCWSAPVWLYSQQQGLHGLFNNVVFLSDILFSFL